LKKKLIFSLEQKVALIKPRLQHMPRYEGFAALCPVTTGSVPRFPGSIKRLIVNMGDLRK